MMKNTIVMFGISGSGRSLVGNAISNQSGSIEKLTVTPFSTAASTKKAMLHENNGIVVVDTAGFETKEEALEKLKEGLQLVDYKVHCIVFVIKCGRIKDLTGEVIDYFSNKIFKDKIRNNSVLVLMGDGGDDDENWLEKNKTNKWVNRLIEMCGGEKRCLELSIIFDNKRDSDSIRNSNFNKREKEIRKLFQFMQNIDFDETNLFYIKKITPKFFNSINRFMFSGILNFQRNWRIYTFSSIIIVILVIYAKNKLKYQPIAMQNQQLEFDLNKISKTPEQDPVPTTQFKLPKFFIDFIKAHLQYYSSEDQYSFTDMLNITSE